MEICKSIKGLVTDLILNKALLFYDGGSEFIVTKNSVSNGKIQSGQPVDMVELRDLFEEALKGKTESHSTLSFIPDNLIAIGRKKIIWYRKSEKRKLFFKCLENKMANKFNGKEFRLPNLIFMATPEVLSVFAFKELCKDAKKTKLYYAPFYNMFGEGNVCLPASAKRPGCAIEDIADWERIFFESNFSHPNAGTKINFKGGHDAFWFDCLKKKVSRFPNDVLVSMKKTLNEITR